MKLFASLNEYLPAGASGLNEAELEIAPQSTLLELLDQLGLPRKKVHILTLDGSQVSPDEFAARGLEPGIEVAMWPPVAGG